MLNYCIRCLSGSTGAKLEHFQDSSVTDHKMALIENDFRLLKKTGEAWLRAQLCIVCISVLWGKRLCSPKPFLLKTANSQRKENQGRVKGTHAEPFQQSFIRAGWKWPLSFYHQYANEKNGPWVREQFPQVHSLATISIIDSQSCHKTGHSLCLSLSGILWGVHGLSSIINH